MTSCRNLIEGSFLLDPRYDGIRWKEPDVEPEISLS